MEKGNNPDFIQSGGKGKYDRERKSDILEQNLKVTGNLIQEELGDTEFSGVDLKKMLEGRGIECSNSYVKTLLSRLQFKKVIRKISDSSYQLIKSNLDENRS